MMGIVTPQALPTYPHGFPHDVIDPFMHATARGVLGNKPASGTEIIQELGEEHQQTGKWIVYTSADSVFQIAAHEETIPLEELYDGCRKAREILTGKHAVGRVIARPFVGEPGDYERTPNRHDFSLEPRRPNYLSQVREAGAEVHGVGKIPDIFAHLDMDDEHPTKSNVEGITVTERLLRDIDSGLVFTNLVETDMLWGHRNDPENFHRCLQDFDRRLPDLLDALREGDLLVITSDHGIDPTTTSTDHSREYGLLLAYVQGKNAAGRIHEGEFARRRRDGERVARREGGARGDLRHSRSSSREAAQRSRSVVRREYATRRASRARSDLRARRRARMRATSRSQAVAEVAPRRVLEVGCGRGELAERMQRELGADVVAVDQSRADGRARARARASTRGSATSRSCRSRTGRSTAPSPPGCSTTCPTSTARSPSSRACCGPAAGWSRSRTASDHLLELWALVGRDRPRTPTFFTRERRGAPARGTSRASSGATPTGRSRSPTGRRSRRYVGSRSRTALADRVPRARRAARRAPRVNVVFVADRRDPPGRAHRAEARRRGARRRRDSRARARLRARRRSPTTRWPRSAWPCASAGSPRPRRSR